MTVGKSVRLFLADGTPGGLLTAEIMNWTGHVIAAPRSDLPALLKRRETSRTGIYILLGDDPESVGGLMAYVGEGDDVSKRLYQHARPEDQGGRDFWDRAIVITSKDANLTKAHARYLESRFITLALQANRAKLINATAPQPIVLPEADVSDMEFFTEQARIVLPVLGVNILRAPAVSSSQRSASLADRDLTASPIFELVFKKEDACSPPLKNRRWSSRCWQAQQPASSGRAPERTTTAACARGWSTTGHLFVRQAVPEPVRFTHSQVFASPSAAAAIVVGRSANGRNEWMTAEGRVTL